MNLLLDHLLCVLIAICITISFVVVITYLIYILKEEQKETKKWRESFINLKNEYRYRHKNK
ncbi:hypothetical protein [Candidatus Borreliella tachyglossi]|uniref:hypothetical protein n=1 Tax=Candidatus Borreliella tachyglossi TaxID=1964448 RepID=UPI00131EF0FD|nr:hypothetical protein [Candidatus Borreliella tachyglossi]